MPDASPQMIYKYFAGHVNSEDKQVISNAISRILNGERVEFEFRWSNLSSERFLGRVIATKAPSKDNVTRVEGLIRNIATYKTLRSQDQARRTALKLFSNEYEYVAYINIGPTQDDDIVEDYKLSDFISNLTNNWEGKITFVDRLNLILHNFLSTETEKYKTYLSNDNRAVLLEELKTKDTVTKRFSLKHFGLIYKYEATFFADRNNVGNLLGIICGLRLVKDFNKIVNTSSITSRVKDFKIKGIEDTVYNVILKDAVAAYLVNLKDRSFDILKREELVSERNKIVPDFEVYFNTYIKQDVYYEDYEMMNKECTINSFRKNITSNDSYSIHYRDVSTGKPLYYSMKVIKKDNNYCLVILSNVDEAFSIEKKSRLEKEEMLHKQDYDIQNKEQILRNLNKGFLDFISSIADSKTEKIENRSYIIRKITHLLTKQFILDYPEYNLDNDYITFLSEASILHDIGKLVIPEKILLKEGHLSKDEFEIIKTHCEKGADLLEKMKINWNLQYYQIVREICLYHHERWDGNGYPFGLKGEDIPISAQIMGLVDSFDALISTAAYRGPVTSDIAYKMIISGRCGLFNPKILDSFKTIYPQIKKLVDEPINVTETNEEKKEREFNPFSSVLNINDQTLPVLINMSEQIPCGFLIYKKDEFGTLLFFNHVLIKYFKCDSREDFKTLVNNSFGGIVHRDDHDYVISKINNLRMVAKENDSVLKFRILCKDGEERYVENYGHLIHSDLYGDIFYSFLVDVTDSEKALVNLATPLENKPNENIADSSVVDETEPLIGTRILLVDDNALSRFNSKKRLTNSGAIVNDFSTAKEALEVIKKVKPYDIILIDLGAHQVNGLNFIKSIRESEKDKNVRVPIIAILEDQESDFAKKCLELGANGCMKKPLSLSRLSRILIYSMREHSKRMEETLENTIRISNTDILTHVKNAKAYWEKIEELNRLIDKDKDHKFGVVILDINRLKKINDAYGHDVGDIYIRNCSAIVCNIWVHSPVYRFGGDEFAVILEGNDYNKSAELMQQFYNTIELAQEIEDVNSGRACMAGGLAIYDNKIDFSVQDVIKRADEVMYTKKNEYERKHPL